MKKYIIIATLSLCNITWSMDHTKQTPETVDTNAIKKIVPSLQKEPVNIKAGLAILEHINNNSGFHVTIHSQKVTGNIPDNSPNPRKYSSSTLFTMHNTMHSKL